MKSDERDGLIQFIREQTFGPFALDQRFVFTGANEATTIETLDAPPGLYYCTGVLFPKEILSQVASPEFDRNLDATLKNQHEKAGDGDLDKKDSLAIETYQDKIPITPQSVPVPETIEEGFDDGLLSPPGLGEAADEDESTLNSSTGTNTGNQTFPVTMGITFSLSKDAQPKDLIVETEFRTYRRATIDERRQIGLRLDMEYDVFVTLSEVMGVENEIKVIQHNQIAILTTMPSTSDAMLKDAMLDKQQHFANYFKTKHPELSNFISNESINKTRAHLAAELRNNDNEKVRRGLSTIDGFRRFKAHIRSLRAILGNDIWLCLQHTLPVTYPPGIDFDIPLNQHTRHLTENENLIIYKAGEAVLKMNLLLINNFNSYEGSKLLKIQLENSSEPVSRLDYSIVKSVVNERAFFGVTLRVKSRKITPYYSIANRESPNRADASQYIYRDYHQYAVGHGCSVDWSRNEQDIEITTSYLPVHHAPDVRTNPTNTKGVAIFPEKAFDIYRLSTLSAEPNEEVLKTLRILETAYSRWIYEKKEEYRGQNIALKMLNECERDSARIRTNIDKLAGDPHLLRLFRYMNTAMFWQMDSTNRLSNWVNGDPPMPGANSWRPFQLAFIVLNLDGILNLDSDARDQIDLVWFPTGGGKTEAYLALITLCIFHRRTTFKEKGNGTCVIMRYTLRLLAMQQFQRATRLILILEIMRKMNFQDLQLGNEAITIGLWAGKRLTPNKFSDLDEQIKELLERLNNNKTKNSTNRKYGLLQFFDSCPACSTPLIEELEDRKNVIYSTGQFPSELHCPNPHCSFSKKRTPLPIFICDEEIYQCAPTLLFGTVDKFALLGRKIDKSPRQDSRRLFGYRSKGSLCRPPDLIIQDELHLISGPLGSAIGLVETAIYRLCFQSDTNVGPKIITSTATIKNAERQIDLLYRKKVNLFPKPGPTITDSFFSQASGNTGGQVVNPPNRSFLGLFPTGRSNTWMQLRALAICLTYRIICHKKLGDKIPGFEETLDHYYTILSYYNSLRELGKTSSQTSYYLEREVRRIYKNVLLPDYSYEMLYTDRIKKTELTGRMTGSQIKEAFHATERSFKLGSEPRPPDLVLATNLISVGLHVERLNTMVVNGMPRSISEYIQSTSRIARTHHGLVLIVHHPYRVRDVSHFEHFREFHERIYQFVEPISITPITHKILKRYLGLFCAILVRHKINDLALNSDAKEIIKTGLNEKAKRFVKLVLTKGLDPEKQKLAEDCLEKVFKEWVDHASDQTDSFGYEVLFQTRENTKSWWYVPNSLRSVEAQTAIRILTT